MRVKILGKLCIIISSKVTANLDSKSAYIPSLFVQQSYHAAINAISRSARSYAINAKPTPAKSQQQTGSNIKSGLESTATESSAA